ncbi:MAG: prepilin-type N-terminal cleavage/methylation domain-containing protein [Candidatus Zixiibacteriota bacterium]
MKKLTIFCSHSRPNQAGHTLLEVLVALLIMGVITTAIFQTYIVQHKNYMAQENVTNVQQNARAAIQELTRQARMAGYAVPNGVQPIRPANANPDSLTVTYKSGDCDPSLSVAMASMSDKLQVSTSVSCIQSGQYAYIVHPDSGGGEWFQINNVDTLARVIYPALPLSKAYTLGTLVVPLQQVTYFVDKSDAASPKLMLLQRGGVAQVFAENIIDLQVTYRMKNGYILDAPINVEDVREILISLSGQSTDAQFDTKVNRKNARVFQTAVYLRNIGS